MANTLVVGTFKTRTEAELAKNLLDSNGIESVTLSGDVGGTDPGLSVFPYSPVTAVDLSVDEKDEIKAKEIIKKLVNNF